MYRELRRVIDAYDGERPRMTIGELHHPEFERWARYYGEDLDEIHLPFNFHLLRAPWEAGEVRAVVDGIEAALPDGAWANWVLGNHDQPRIASRVGCAQARVAMLLLLSLRGAPTLYYGDEIGMTNVAIPPERVRDPWEGNVPGQGRDPQRTPMQWDGGPNAGFCPAEVEPWLPLAPDADRVHVAAQAEDPASLLSLTRNLLALRRRHPTLAVGSYRPVDDTPEGCFCFTRQTDETAELVALNLVDEPRRLMLDGSGTVLIGTHPDRDKAPVDGTLELRANEGLVVALDQPPGR